MQFLFGRSEKQRVRHQQKLDRQRNTRQKIRAQLETLETRKLLAVDMNDNFEQLFDTPGDSGSGLTQDVSAEIAVPTGADQALVIAANYTDTSAGGSVVGDLTFEVTMDGALTTFTVDSGVGNSLTIDDPTAAFVPDGTVVGSGAAEVIPVGLVNGTTQISSLVIVLPIGSNTMERDISVRLLGGVSTDFVAIAGTYAGVDQDIPVDITNAQSGGNTATGITGFTTLALPDAIPAGNEVFDAVFGVQTQTPFVPLTDMDPFADGVEIGSVTDGAIGPVVVPGVTTTQSDAAVYGAFSTDDDSTLDWQFISGSAGFSHAAVEINMEDDPTILLYDFGDAPDNYGTTLAVLGAHHAPKGPKLGQLRDAEADANGPLDGTG